MRVHLGRRGVRSGSSVGLITPFLVDPLEPALGEWDNVLGLHAFVHLAHLGEKRGHGLEDAQASNRSIAIR